MRFTNQDLQDGRLDCSQTLRRVTLLEEKVCVSEDDNLDKSASGLTPSIPELDSIVAARSLTKPSEEEGADSVYWELQELLDKPVPSGSKENINTPSRSDPKVGMNSKKVKRSGSSSRITDSRSYTYEVMHYFISKK